MINFIKRFKPSYAIYNFFKKKELEHNLPLFKQLNIKKKYYSSLSSKDVEGLTPAVYENKDVNTDIANSSLDQNIKDQLANWGNDGYAILSNFFSNEEIDTFNSEVERLIKTKKAKWRTGNRIMFACHDSTPICNAGTDNTILTVLNTLMGKEVELFQSINFINASQQRTHSDTIHMTTHPLGNLIAIWIALEDVDTNNGPLHYYPGSHKLPYVLNKDFGNEGSALFLGKKSYGDYEDKIEEIIKTSNLKKEQFHAKKGDLLIWHANLLHGGEPVIDNTTTRKSMVFHYYTKDAICYHELTERPSLKKDIICS